jgi:NADPH-dependent 2,4-dienoyl-CoA reductase/sulfur reductase-like enzyme
VSAADVVVVGAGPGGIAAAVSAAQCGRRVTLVDDNPAAGGQIWRGESGHGGGPLAESWITKLGRSNVDHLNGARVIAGDAKQRSLTVETPSEAIGIRYQSLVLATGARELFLPFPGWTLPNVMGAGGLQALVKAGLPIRGKRVVVAGTGPLLLAVASYLRKQGATVPWIAEQAGWGPLLRFSLTLAGHPGKLGQAASFGLSEYRPGSWVVSAEGRDTIDRVHIRCGSKTRVVDCDYLAIGYGLCPNAELAHHLGCRVKDGAVSVDPSQQTSIEGIYCAGEACGIGGVDLAIAEGEIAGLAASGRSDLASDAMQARNSARKFATALNRTFSLRPELRSLAAPETIVCRCEDVRFGQLKSADGWRAAKLHLRCGMGPCQGRICGPAVRFLLGWEPESVRPPVFPARVASLIGEAIQPKEGATK